MFYRRSEHPGAFHVGAKADNPDYMSQGRVCLKPGRNPTTYDKRETTRLRGERGDKTNILQKTQLGSSTKEIPNSMDKESYGTRSDRTCTEEYLSFQTSVGGGVSRELSERKRPGRRRNPRGPGNSSGKVLRDQVAAATPAVQEAYMVSESERRTLGGGRG